MSLLKSSSAPETPPRFWGEYQAHEHCSSQNILNLVLCLLALLPSFVSTAVLFSQCATEDSDDWSTLGQSLCTLALNYPVWMANVLFFVNVSLGFWVIGLIQRSFWLIDPYWTFIPPLLCLFYQTNPKATSNCARSVVSSVLICVWAVRLTYSYFRREEWKFGQQEDWRYTKMAKDYPDWWWLLSFFAVGVAQQPMLIGIALPAYSVSSSDDAWNVWDTIACVLAVSGLLLAYFADTQLYGFMQQNRERVRTGSYRLPVLNTGLWRYSRHPNYVGETMWWLGYGFFAVAVGQWYMLGGWVLNTAVLLQVTWMTESRMSGNRSGDRLVLWELYKETTPCWLPGVCGLVGEKVELDRKIAEYESTGKLNADT